MNLCDRCPDTPFVTVMSRFNTDILCRKCEELEKAHPGYKEACEVELAEVRKGNLNYPGIGKPADL